MASKIFTGLTVVFWLAMMTALVRVEYFPQPTALASAPTERVLKKIFAHPEPARLSIYHQGARIGFLRVEITPLGGGDEAEPLPPGETPKVYRVASDLKMTLSVFGTPSRLWLKGKSIFNPQYDLESFNISTSIGDGRVNIAGDERSKKVTVSLELADIHEQRVLDFGQVKGAGLANAFGLPGLGNFSFLGGAGMTAFGRPSSAEENASSKTRTYLDRIEIAGGTMSAFLIESKMDDTMWAKMWVSEAGEVLRVETSMGLTMVNDVLLFGATDGNGKLAPRKARKGKN